MKIGGAIGLILLVSGIFLASGIIISDFETNYVDTNITTISPIDQNLSDDLVSESELNETFTPIQEKVDDLGSQDGFLDVLTDGSVVLPKLFIDFAMSILTMGGLAKDQAVVLLDYIGIPLIIISFIIVAIGIWFLLKIIEQVRRYPT